MNTNVVNKNVKDADFAQMLDKNKDIIIIGLLLA